MRKYTKNYLILGNDQGTRGYKEILRVKFTEVYYSFGAFYDSWPGL